MKKEKSGTKSVPPKIPQPNGGALYAGGVPGNKGGTGRPPNLARYKAGEALVDGVDRMKQLMYGAKEESNQIRAFEALAKLLPALTGEDPDNPIFTPEERKARLKALFDQR